LRSRSNVSLGFSVPISQCREITIDILDHSFLCYCVGTYAAWAACLLVTFTIFVPIYNGGNEETKKEYTVPDFLTWRTVPDFLTWRVGLSSYTQWLAMCFEQGALNSEEKDLLARTAQAVEQVIKVDDF